MEMFFKFKFHRGFFLKGSIDKKSLLDRVMAWCQTGSKPLAVPMLTQFTDSNIQHQGVVSI